MLFLDSATIIQALRPFDKANSSSAIHPGHPEVIKKTVDEYKK
ncbi:hypothetical protein SDC9_203290 [bioreactor metagenome]|uniref:Uncharacterized protein n=1 Tax=bioreactor metagenome TaxID=1076179 RepID=A0A645IWM8_9ZZZZ